MTTPWSREEQDRYIADVAQIMQVRARGEMPLALVRTYGCQQNVADGEKIKGMLEKMGFGFTDKEEEADFILFNTCAVREHAEDRIYGNVGALKNIKRRNPSLIIALCGCMMEQEHVADRIRQSFPFVNLVFGTHVIHRFPQLLREVLTDSHRVFERGDDSEDKTIIEGLPVHRDGHGLPSCMAVTISVPTVWFPMSGAGSAAGNRKPSSRSSGSWWQRDIRKLPCWART